MNSLNAALSAVLLLVLSIGLRAADDPAIGRRQAQAALKPYGGLVGEWRGTGQPQRGSARGAWRETAGWVWKLSKDSAALEMTVAKGKYLKSGLLKPGKEPGTFTLDAVLADDSKRTFTGKAVEKKGLVLTAAPPKGDGVRRITINPIHDTRTLVLLESLEPDGRTYDRLGEVGYTREGVAFAAGESGPVCIVTEGRGTMQVSYKGKTYHVCCSGCKDLFNENPEAILAEAAARQKNKK